MKYRSFSVAGRLLAPAMLCPLLVGCPLFSSLVVQTPLAQTRIGLSLVADGFTCPVGLATPNDATGRLFIVDQIGKIFIIDTDGNLLPTPFLDITSRMVTLSPGGDERGLLSIAFHPRYAENARFFVTYNAPLRPTDPAGFDCVWRLSEFHVSAGDANLADPASEAVLLEVLKPQANHNGGQLAFGPDGFLYVSIGDGGGAGDVGVGHTATLGNAQDRTVLLGKLLRVGADTPGTLTIPINNPFVSSTTIPHQIFAYGLRNPWRFSFDIQGGQRLFLGDVGQNLFEEIDLVRSGDDLGWNIKEGRHCFSATTPTIPPATCPSTDVNGQLLVNPIIEYSHRNAGGQTIRTAVIGGYVYRGSEVRDLFGRYVFGDFADPTNPPGGVLLIAEQTALGNWNAAELRVATSTSGRIGRNVLAFGQDLRGEMYVLTNTTGTPTGATGEVFKIVVAP